MCKIGIAASSVQFARSGDFEMNLVELEIRPDAYFLSLSREKKFAWNRGTEFKNSSSARLIRRLIREKRPGKVCGASETPVD